jgi:hypothetical protein
MPRFALIVTVAILGLLVACSSGGDTTTTPTTSPDSSATDEPTAAATDEATAAPTDEATAEPTEEASGSMVWGPYVDGQNDCQRNSDYAAAPVCMPPDIESITISRASPLTIVIAFRAPPATDDWQVTIGFDLDNDPTTGITDGIWGDFHQIGPDLEFDYFANSGGAPLAQAHEIEPGPVFNRIELGPPEDAVLGMWSWPDGQTLQLIVDEELLPESADGFYVAGQTMQPDYHDPFPDSGPVMFP